MNFSKVVGRNLKILAVWLASTKRVDRAKVWGTNNAFCLVNMKNHKAALCSTGLEIFNTLSSKPLRFNEPNVKCMRLFPHVL